MIAIHHIKTIRASTGRFADSNYLEIRLVSAHPAEEPGTNLTLYFDRPEPGLLKALAAAINSVCPDDPISPDYGEDYSAINEDIPF